MLPPSLDVELLVGRDWRCRSYRAALADLLGLGWLPCGVGDWAIALRSSADRTPPGPAVGEGSERYRAGCGETAALAIDAEYRARVPWWDGIDINPGNVRSSTDCGLKLIDIFCMKGAALYGQILEDAAVVGQRLPGWQADYERAWRNGDLDAVAELFTEDAQTV